MLQAWRYWRERGWTVIDAEAYRQVWMQFGGSVATHPDFVDRLAGLAGIPVRYLGWEQEGRLVAAVPCWGRHLALSKDVLKQSGKRRLFDLGNAEVILPVAEDACVPVRQQVSYVSELNVGRIETLRHQPEQLAFARPHEDYKGRYRYNLRRDWRILQENGATRCAVAELSIPDRARIYADLFQRRWGFEAPGKAHLEEVFELLQDFMAGSVLFMDDKPIAFQVLYRVDSPLWISMEYINGGVDPDYNEYSPGSVLTFLNTLEGWDAAKADGKVLRYSFGRDDREYKKQWCHSVQVYRV